MDLWFCFEEPLASSRTFRKPLYVSKFKRFWFQKIKSAALPRTCVTCQATQKQLDWTKPHWPRTAQVLSCLTSRRTNSHAQPILYYYNLLKYFMYHKMLSHTIKYCPHKSQLSQPRRSKASGGGLPGPMPAWCSRWSLQDSVTIQLWFVGDLLALVRTIKGQCTIVTLAVLLRHSADCEECNRGSLSNGGVL